MRRNRAVLAVVVLLLGYTAADAADVAPGFLTTDPPPAEAQPFPDIALPGGSLAAPAVAGPDDSAEVPTTAGLEEVVAAFSADSRRTGSFGLVIADAITGEVLLDHDGGTARPPASSLKILTGAASLSTLGAGATLTTSAVLSGDSTVTLVAGGDTLLAAGEGNPRATDGHAGLGDLAARTAEALAERGIDEVAVDLDDTLFTGPDYHPDWGPIDRTFVSAVQPIAIDSGRTGSGYSSDPGADAVVAFADALESRGVAVSGVDRGVAPEDAEELGSVESAPITAVVRHMLKSSDNSLAEVLSRLVAVERGAETTFPGATGAVRGALSDLGVDVSDVTMSDASGLNPASTVPPAVLVDVLRLANNPDNPAVHGLSSGLPVGGLDGTLAERFTADAAGQVRAKTGTLVRSASLSGLVTTADGRPLHFSVITSNLQVGTHRLAHQAIDTLVTDLAACGCR
ncbi:D-alanyl-D-alanine carboxypeptidase/D-alanyl-D-alanine-endopeptidase [Georgenia deserti]|uniref:D-alanyl-D-alanine carboxypeptidase/D-alanyl-D-alanine-endopeptidase n=1 Tax=Georgenia deserti TaxID=2093781 RepID=A0ABW4L382_9MICO